jgi:hypothetical protein
MEIIDFKAGPQVATATSSIVVRDINGGLWTVLKNIGYASAQPREGAYYTRYTEPVSVEPAFDYKAAYDTLALEVQQLKQSENVVILIDSNLHKDDFYMQEVLENGVRVQKIRIKR